MSKRYSVTFEFPAKDDDEAAGFAAELLYRLNSFMDHTTVPNIRSALHRENTEWKLLAEPVMSRNQLAQYREGL